MTDASGHPCYCLSGPRLCCARPGILRKAAELLRPLCSVFRPPLLAVLDPLGIEHAAQDVVAHAREILHASAADHHHGMLLKVMALAGDVADHLEPVGEP